MSDSEDSGSYQIRVADTSAENVHGNTVIKPGDRVEFQSRMCRVIEVSPEKSKLLIYKSSAVHAGAESIHSEAVTKYEPRER